MSKRRPWTSNELRRLEEMYRDDISYDAIARSLGRSEKAIKQQCTIRKLGRTHKRSRDMKLSPRLEEEIVRLYRDESTSMTVIARRFEMSRSFIRKVLNQNGVRLRTREEDYEAGIKNPKRVIPFEEFYRAYFTECLTVDEIKKRFGCGHTTLMSNLEIHGLANLTQLERIKIRDQYRDTGKTLKYIREKQEAL